MKNASCFYFREGARYFQLVETDASQREKSILAYFELDKRIRYKVKSGIFLAKTAERFGVRVREIKPWNRLQTSRLKIGQRVGIYPKK